MDFSFLGVGLSIGLTFLLLITTIALLIVAAVYLKTTASGTVTSTMANNNTKAMYYFIGALVALGLLMLFNGFFTLGVFSSSYLLQPALALPFGWGTYLLLSLNVVLMLIAIVLIFLGYSNVDPVTANTNGELVRSLALSSGIITGILLLPLVYMFIDVSRYNKAIEGQIIPVTEPFGYQCEEKSLLSNQFDKYSSCKNYKPFIYKEI